MSSFEFLLPEAILSPRVPALDRPHNNPTHIPVAGGEFRINRYLLTEGQRQGVEVIVVDSVGSRVALCPTRGLGIWRANLGGLDCKWDSPVDGPIHPTYVPVSEPTGLGWLDGFDELLVRCGIRSFGAPDFKHNGQLQYSLHGRIANLPAQNIQILVDEEQARLIVRGTVLETRFLFYSLKLDVETIFKLGEPSIEVRDTVTNVGDTATTMQLLYHINLGTPVIEGGSELHLAANEIVARDTRAVEDLSGWDTYLPPTAGYAEQVYFSQPLHVTTNNDDKESSWTTALLCPADRRHGFALQFDTSTLPYFSQWKNTCGESDGYVTGLEPGTGFPNPRSFEEAQGRVVELLPGQQRIFQLRLEGLGDASQVQATIDQITQAGSSASLLEYKSGWCTPRD